MRLEQEVGVELLVADELPHERKAVRVQAGGREADNDVSRLAAGAVDQVGAPNETDAGAREVELALAVDPRELCRLPAEDRAAGLAADDSDALDELGDLLEIEVVGGDVVEEEERLRSGREHVVDAVGGKVATRIEEPAGPSGEHQLRADSVRGRGEEALVVELVEAGEAADVAARGGHRGAQALDDRLRLAKRDASG